MSETTKAIEQMRKEGFDDQQILDALCDGEALAAMGLGDEDQADIEDAYTEIQKAMQSKAAAILGRKGGQVKSERKAEAVRANGAKGGRPKSARILVRSNYGDGSTTELILSNGRTATRRQYEAALSRLRAAEGDYLRRAERDQPDIVVYDGDREWAVIH